MKILYISGMHPVLEYDECIVFEDLGFDWFSTGIYYNPETPINITSLNIRKPILKSPNPELISLLMKSNPNYHSSFKGLSRPAVKLSKDLVSNFDLIFSTSVTQIIDNWEVLKDKPIIWRTVGSINNDLELKMKPYVNNGNIKPVRFSSQELLAPDSNGGHIIKNYVDEDIYRDWSGEHKTALSFQSWFTQRRSLNINKAYIKIHSKIPASLYGAFVGSPDPLSNGSVSWDEQINLYKKARCYFYIGSPVGVVAYNFLEAMMTGTPIVTFGPKIGGFISPKGDQLLHEASEIIENTVNGFYSDNLDQIVEYINQLVGDPNLAKSVSENARKTALTLFSKKQALIEWREFFSNIT